MPGIKLGPFQFPALSEVTACSCSSRLCIRASRVATYLLIAVNSNPKVMCAATYACPLRTPSGGASNRHSGAPVSTIISRKGNSTTHPSMTWNMRHIYYAYISEIPSQKMELCLLVIIPTVIMAFYLAPLAPLTLIQQVNHLAQ